MRQAGLLVSSKNSVFTLAAKLASVLVLFSIFILGYWFSWFKKMQQFDSSPLKPNRFSQWKCFRFFFFFFNTTLKFLFNLFLIGIPNHFTNVDCPHCFKLCGMVVQWVPRLSHSFRVHGFDLGLLECFRMGFFQVSSHSPKNIQLGMQAMAMLNYP